MNKWDFLLIGIISLFAVSLLGFYSDNTADAGQGPKLLQIYLEDKLYKEIEIPNEDYTQTFSVLSERGMNTIKIKDGTAFMLEADCPDHLCEDSHPISKPNEILVCMPNRVILSIVSE
ncbi:NusG domain II-containing protein [Paenibacillus dakarensis]|uniref:NusG domain II-containing protein n=1 Tax=Paenibacillus dakarensis TaxID=1527293 RepID=UPI0006D54A7C|nr:NusG domain II-containing protein [Paenibacillus dakarensis]